MKYMKAMGGIAAIALVVIGVGVALAVTGIRPQSTLTGIHMLTLTSTTKTDSGVGFYRLTGSGSDSITQSALYLMRGASLDTVLALNNAVGTAGSGIPKKLTGSVTDGTGTFFAQTGDTAGRATATISYTDQNIGAGTWSSTFTGASGQTSASTFMDTTQLDTKVLHFGLSRALATFDVLFDSSSVSDSLNTSTESVPAARISQRLDTYIIVSVDSTLGTNPGDTMRFILEGPNGTILRDSQMTRTSVNDTQYFSPIVPFDSGTSKIYIIFWDATAKKYAFRAAVVIVGSKVVAATVGSTSTSDTMGAIRNVAVTNSSASVVTVEFIDLANDTGPRSPTDAFLANDSNTANFDTRLPFTVFQINLYDASGNRVFTLPNGQSELVVVTFTIPNGIAPADFNRITLLRLNDATNTWERIVGINSLADSRITTTVSSFSTFSFGAISTGGSSAAGSNGNCVIDNALGHTSFAGVMPSLRGVRDTVLSSSIGRLLVTGYYGFAGTIALMIAAGFGLTAAAGKRR